MELNHNIIPVRNIDLKFNLSDTSHYVQMQGNKYTLEDIYFSGLQEHYRNAQIHIKGKVHVIGICFFPEGSPPFVKIPLSEFKNQLLGTEEISFNIANAIPNCKAEFIPDEGHFSLLPNHAKAILTTLVHDDPSNIA